MAPDHRDRRAPDFDIVVSAVGLFTRPVLPDLIEEEPFTGTVMHSSRRDHSVDLGGARVAVLGTGSTPSQLVPELAGIAGRVYWVQQVADLDTAQTGPAL